MFTGETVTLMVAFISGYFFALFLGPTLYGVWQTAKIFINMAALFSLSLPFVMRRDFITLRAEGKLQEANNIAYLVLTYQLIVTPIVAICLTAYALFFIEDYALKISILAVAAIYILQIIGAFGNILTKGLNNYKTLRNASILNGALTILIIPAVYFWGYPALIWGTIIVTFVNSVYYYIKRPINYKFYWNNTLFKSLFFITFPLYLQDISSTIFDSIDRLIIANYLSFKEVGLYSLSSFLNLPLKLFIASFSVVLFTHLNENFGSQINYAVIKKHVIIPQDIMCWVVPPLIGLLVFLLPFLVRTFLPKYLEGVEAAQISIFASFFYLLTSFSSNALFVLNQQRRSAVIFFIVGIVNTLFCFLSLHLNWGLNGIAFATLLAYLLFDFLMLFFVFKNIAKSVSDFLTYKLYNLLPVTIIAAASLLYWKFIKDGLYQYVPDTYLLRELIGCSYILIIGTPFIYLGIKRLIPYLKRS